jgi:5-deoxy-5-amino-3-dehydroquinate synthase
VSAVDADDRFAVIPVPLGGDRSYDVIVGDGARHRLVGVVPSAARRAAVVTQPGIGVEVDSGREQQVFTIGVGERSKQMATVESLCSSFARWGLTRTDVVVSVGGGMVTDVAGFAAAVYHRGTAVVHVPTTLLGQVDAAIGGKTGVNLAEGKNLVGAFWQPTAVLCDTEVLASLPEREWRSGRGEVAKYAFLGGEGVETLPLVEQVAACVRIKADVVASDERESGRRAKLNYGHTIAHALETVGAYDLRHGEAVAIGLVGAAELARSLGRIDDARVAEHRRIVAAYDLPLRPPEGMDAAALVEVMRRDKKVAGGDGGLTFVLDGPVGVETVREIDPVLVVDVLESMR